MAAQNATRSMMRAVLLLPALLLILVSVSAEYYAVTNPNVREGSCTPRCVDSTTPGSWRCSDVTDHTGASRSMCNTFELDGDHSCHFHHMSQQETGACMDKKKLNFVIIGQSNGVGLMTSVSTWFDRADGSYMNPLYWFDDSSDAENDLIGTFGSEDIWALLTAQVNLDENGLIKLKIGSASGASIKQTADAAAARDSTTTGSKITFYRATAISHAYDALNSLAYAGRQNDKGFMVINMGSYFSSTSSYKSAMIPFLGRVQKEFTNYHVFLMGYSIDDDAANNVVMQDLVTQYKPTMDIRYFNTYDMVHGVNGPKFSGGHMVHMTNLAIFQRMLAFECADQGEVECEEQMIASSNCQWNSGETSWYHHWYRQCNYMTYTSNSPPFPSPPEPAGPSPEQATAANGGGSIPAPAPSTPATPPSTPTTPVTPPSTPTTPVIPPSTPTTPVTPPSTPTTPSTTPSTTPAVPPPSTPSTPVTPPSTPTTPSTTPSTTPTVPVTAPETPTVSAPSSPQQYPASSCPNTAEGTQCQGENFLGARCCTEGMDCKYIDVSFSGCFRETLTAGGGDVNAATNACDNVFCSGKGYCTQTDTTEAFCHCDDGESIAKGADCLAPSDPALYESQGGSDTATAGSGNGSSGGGSSGGEVLTTGAIVGIAVAGGVIGAVITAWVVSYRMGTRKKIHYAPTPVAQPVAELTNI